MNPDSACMVFPSGKCITVDYFNGVSTVYFLSHFHMDHVVGLRDIKHQCKIYCSEITRQLVLADQSFRAAHAMLAGLPVGPAHPVPELPGLSVTLVPAGHCLGSVMFLFADDCGGHTGLHTALHTGLHTALHTGLHTALHTGDFRIPTELGALRGVAAFHSSDGGVIPIDNAVVDTTFFTEHCRRLPTRAESMREICGLVGDCLDRRLSASGDRRDGGSGGGGGGVGGGGGGGGVSGVLLSAKARFSYESVYETLAETFNTKVHISERALGYYGQVASGLHFYSTRADDCFVHLAGCGCSDTWQMLNICLSTMYFDKTAGFAQPVVWPGERTVRVLFSFHPSMQEVADLLAYLRPRAALALVIPSGDTAAAVQARLDAALSTFNYGETATTATATTSRICSLKRRFDFGAPPVAAASAATPVGSVGVGEGDGGDGDGDDSDDSLCAVPAARPRIS